MIKKLIFFIFVGTLFFYFYNHKNEDLLNNEETSIPLNSKSSHKDADKHDKKIETKSITHNHHDHKLKNKNTKKMKKRNDKFIPTDEFEENLKEVASLYHEIIFHNEGPDKLIEFLDLNQLEPRVAKNKLESENTVSIIRSTKSLPGVRYFHGQFVNQNNTNFVEHLSFEFIPGPKSYQRAKDLIETEFEIQSRTIYDNDNMTLYSLENCRIAWAKKLQEEDLESDLYNAYDKDDIGTIHIAFEHDPHCE